jgi:hypothetical protein
MIKGANTWRWSIHTEIKAFNCTARTASISIQEVAIITGLDSFSNSISTNRELA